MLTFDDKAEPIKRSDIYKAVSDRERLADRQAWQLPAIVFTAAAVFLTIITDTNRSAWPRLWSGLALFGVGLGFAFVLLRMRKSALLDSEWQEDALENDVELYVPHGQVWALNRSDISFKDAFPRRWAAVYGLWLSMCLVSLVGYVSVFSILVSEFHLPWGLGIVLALALAALMALVAFVLHRRALASLNRAWTDRGDASLNRRKDLDQDRKAKRAKARAARMEAKEAEVAAAEDSSRSNPQGMHA